jgi:hypothetical protein
MKNEIEEYTLRYPVEVPAETIAGVNGHPDIVAKPGQVYAKLIFNPIEAGMMPAIEAAAATRNEAALNIVIIAQLTRTPADIVKRLRLPDFDAAKEIAGGFFPDTPAQSTAGVTV